MARLKASGADGARTARVTTAPTRRRRHLRPRLDEIAVHVAERDRPLRAPATTCCSSRADLAIAAADRGAGRRHIVAVDQQSDQLARDAAVAAVQHADDHFLADVAPLVKLIARDSMPASSGIVSSSMSR